MDIFSPTLLEIFSVLIVFSWITKILRHRFVDKTIIAYIALPDERKERLIRRYKSNIKIWRIFLWVMPFFFLLYLVLPVMLFIYPFLVSGLPGIQQVVLLTGIGFVVGYITVGEDWYYKKKILKAIDKPAEREIA